ncbi:type II toxin-antitoxin system HipA family toxin [Sphaerotilus sp.]|uniref:type II toxin-antitoxin system HipA family toxin n=1 Tax=Sphaerotilus sp. TaxID=2093942 RepID=UPI00286E09D7|nr:type II toxin-antitoxin system HipA family toxin [Sphaerotilus sp.]
MARRSQSQALSIWSNGERVGTWRLPANGPMELRYDAAWMASPQGRPLSLSLPFRADDAPHAGEQVGHYFENLLPDSDEIRKRLASKFRTASIGAFDLLQAIGRDCVGAVQLLPEDDTPTGFDRIEGTVLDDAAVEQYLSRVVAPAALRMHDADEDDFRLSLAGAQEKTALLRHDGQWLRPHGATPTTHILKLPLGLVGNSRVDLSSSVENEWLCLNLLREYGLPVPSCEILTFGTRRVLSVERFDRRLHPSGQWWLRLPQEDFCQALGLSPHLKYESDGGPGVRDLAQILRQSDESARDIETLLTAQLLFWLLAAPDGHAKNFSLHLLPGGRYRLAPLYDVMSIWPVEGAGPNQWSWHKARLAMAVVGKRRHYHFKEVQRRHFNAMAQHCGHGRDAEAVIERVLAATADVVDRVGARLPIGFSARVFESVTQGLVRTAAALRRMPAR